MASARACACPRWDRHIAVRHPGCLSPLGQAHCRTPSTLAGDHAEGVSPSRS
ncbi:hypothetical protein L523_0809 [Bordetella bronchiseptica MBORD731]|nr:hypothetical protein L523_0809 [Bordetella bronchiseptica MBORD731]